MWRRRIYPSNSTNRQKNKSNSNTKHVQHRKSKKNGFMDTNTENIQTRLEKAATARTLEQEGTIQYESDNPEMTEEQARQLMETLPEGLYKDGVEYYGITHKHPNSNSKYTTASLQKLMAFDVDTHMDLITQPLLMIAGDKADTKYMTDSAYEKATNTKTKNYT